jgi:hypothetical protein
MANVKGNCRCIILALIHNCSPDLAKWPVLLANSAEWMEDAKRIAVAGYRQVLEDGKDVCNSESHLEYSDHGEELSGMYASDMIGPGGKPNLAGARLTTEQANALRAAAKMKAQVQPEQPPPTRVPTRVPSDDDDMSEDQKRLVRSFTKTKKSVNGGAGGQITGGGAGK